MDLSVHPHLMPPGLDIQEIRDFLLQFSRFEFALKQAGYGMMQGSYIKVDYKRVANQLDVVCPPRNVALPDRMATEDIRYMVANPPKRQVLDGDRPTWGDPIEPKKKSSASHFAIECMRTPVRLTASSSSR